MVEEVEEVQSGPNFKHGQFSFFFKEEIFSMDLFSLKKKFLSMDIFSFFFKEEIFKHGHFSYLRIKNF